MEKVTPDPKRSAPDQGETDGRVRREDTMSTLLGGLSQASLTGEPSSFFLRVCRISVVDGLGL